MISTRTDIINFLISKYNFVTYLEIGISGLDNFNKIKIAKKTGVDPGPFVAQYKNTADITFVQKTSDDFFSKLDPKIKFDIIFIDGLHLKDQYLRDVINSLNHLSNNGIIVSHDCNPPAKQCQVDHILKELGMGLFGKVGPN